MPRIGVNPSRNQTLGYTPPRVTVAVLVYAPHQAGYFQHRLDVTRLTIESILANTEQPHELLVFDNGSCPEMVSFLQGLYGQGKIDQLVLSARNIGKLNALYRIAQLACGGVIAYTDDDVYHLPGWLPAHLEVLDTFPNVGAVTGFYIRQRVVMSSDTTLKYAEESVESVERGLLMPHRWEEEYMDNSGRTEERYQSEVAGIQDVVVTCKGIRAWVSAHHFQMLTPKAVLLSVLEDMLPDGWSDQLMGRMVEMDDRMDQKGYLRLTTYRQTMRLLGNVIDPEVVELAKKDGIQTQAVESPAQPKTGLVGKITRNQHVRNGIQGLINHLYSLLHQNGREE
ncbi:MAG: glycosyltransferase family A protein [Anaerolineaceae bacterium]